MRTSCFPRVPASYPRRSWQALQSPTSCREVAPKLVKQLLRELRFGQNSARIGRVGPTLADVGRVWTQLGVKFGQCWPILGQPLVGVVQCLPNLCQFRPILFEPCQFWSSSANLWPTTIDVRRISPSFGQLGPTLGKLRPKLAVVGQRVAHDFAHLRLYKVDIGQHWGETWPTPGKSRTADV